MLSLSIVKSNMPLTTPYSISFTTSRTLARNTDSVSSPAGTRTVPPSICARSLPSIFSRESRLTHTPTMRRPGSATSAVERATSASTTATRPSPEAASRTAATVSPYRPPRAAGAADPEYCCRNFPARSFDSNSAPSATRSLRAGSTKRPSPPSKRRRTSVVFPRPRGPHTSRTGVAATPVVVLSSCSFSRCLRRSVAIFTATPALPGRASTSASPSMGRTCRSKSAPRYVRNPPMAARNCSRDTNSKSPAISKGPELPSSAFLPEMASRTRTGMTNRTFAKPFPFLSIVPSTVVSPSESVLTVRKNK
mmetsp:Transcript_22518/g.45121  ORF Transcript_22518/g.45121 Transcript_22518/m.45121 type:complete len:308 (-) Transcript_22518:968-1891(-)